jgi:hypothetical protein
MRFVRANEHAALEHVAPKALQNLNPGSVDFSEIASSSDVAKAVDWVLGSPYAHFLHDIAYIYNSNDSSSFGVFDPNLDESLKIQILKFLMEAEGYTTEIVENRLYAGKEGESKEEVTAKMQEVKGRLDQKGGLIHGINVSTIEAVSKQNSQDLQAAGAQVDAQDESDLFAMNIGATIVHEGVHAKGDKGEENPKRLQKAFGDYVMESFINPRRAAEGKEPLNSENVDYYSPSGHRSAGVSGEIKTAQMEQTFRWTLIEPLLRLNYEHALVHYDLQKGKHDSMETLLDKNRKDASGWDLTKDTEEAALEVDRNPRQGTLSIEKLLDENRSHPLVGQLKHAGINSNLGGLHISSPFAIDEYLQRVWSWDRDFGDLVDYNSGEDPYWQMRYKPENKKLVKDRFGRWRYEYDARVKIVGPDSANSPTKWTSLFHETVNSSPWFKSSYASNDDPDTNKDKNDVVSALRRVGYWKNLVRRGKKRSVRFLCDFESANFVSDALSDIDFTIFKAPDKRLAFWIHADDVSYEDLMRAEKTIVDQEDVDSYDDVVEFRKYLKMKITFIVKKCKELCRLHGIEDVFIVGGFPRVMMSSKDFLDVNDLDFTSPNPDECLKLGGLLAAELGATDVSMFHRTMTLNFSYDGVKMDFRGNFCPLDVRPILREHGLRTTPINFDVYARDFTINSLLYSIDDSKVYDVTGRGIDDIKAKSVKTIFAPEKVIPSNPLIITRALILNLKGYRLDPALSNAIREMKDLLFSGKVSEERLAYEYVKIEGYGEDGDYVLKDYGLEKLKKIKIDLEKEQPELFE